MRRIAALEIYNDKRYIGAVLNFLDAIASGHSGMEFTRYNRLRYVVGELLQNRIEEAYPGTKGVIEVEVSVSPSCCEVSIKDKGVPAWTDFSYDPHADMRDQKTMRNYMLDQWTDDVGLEQLGKDGQRVFVRMDILHPLEFRPPEPFVPTEVLDTDISIKPVVTHEDAVEAIRCIYSEYGYSYSYDRLYYVDSFLGMIRNGELMSFLAVNEHGQTAGHFALAFSDTFKNMPEITTVVTRKEFRGLGLFAKFMDYCMELGKTHGFRAMMGQPVGFHPMSQKAFLKSGFTATSVLLSYIGSDIESEYNKDHRRLDLFAAVKLLDSTAHSVIYPPKALYGFVENMVSKLGGQYELRQETTVRDTSEIRVENSGSLKSSKVLVHAAGDDLRSILNDTVKDAIRRKYEMIEMLISLNDPSCSEAYEAAKSVGFVLSGMIPGSESGDYLVMQMLIGADCCYDQLVTVGDYEDLKQAIIALNNRKDA